MAAIISRQVNLAFAAHERAAVLGVLTKCRGASMIDTSRTYPQLSPRVLHR